MSVPELPYSEPVRLHQIGSGVKRTLVPDEAAMRRSREAGFDRHVPKFDRDTLLEALRSSLANAATLR